ncbi:MAG: 2-hydroxyacyl-CoA dehydratase [Chloroflexi bacterium]|nr:2-hydroxyacyl-CoA dehydratase [Chloroflexota bacterium]
MVVAANRGLARAKEICQDRPARAKELRAQGKKIMGYLCLYPVIEMMTAVDVVPYRMFGEIKTPRTTADNFLPPVVCPYLRSLLEMGLTGKYDFFDGVSYAHICDGGGHFQNAWIVTVKPTYFHILGTPHTLHESALQHHKILLQDYQKFLEDFTGQKLTTEKLKKAVNAHNQQRALVRELYELKKSDPPKLSGVETMQIMMAIMSLPVDEGTQLLQEAISEIKQRKLTLTKKPARLMMWGSIMDYTELVEMIESLDANVVMDDTCVGSRAFFDDVKMTDDPLDGLTYHYLADLKCPRTYKEAVVTDGHKDYKADIENRFSYIQDFAKDWKVNGVILEAMRYCDAHAYDVPQLKDYLDSIGLPNIYLELDYTEASLAPLRTRVQGLVELIG